MFWTVVLLFTCITFRVFVSATSLAQAPETGDLDRLASGPEAGDLHRPISKLVCKGIRHVLDCCVFVHLYNVFRVFVSATYLAQAPETCDLDRLASGPESGDLHRPISKLVCKGI